MKQRVSSFLLCLLSVCLLFSGNLRTGSAGAAAADPSYSQEFSCQRKGPGQAGTLSPAAAGSGPSEMTHPAPARFPAVAVPEKTDAGQAEENIQEESSDLFRGDFSGKSGGDPEILSFSVLGAILFAFLLLIARSLFCPYLLVQARILSYIHSQDGLK